MSNEAHRCPRCGRICVYDRECHRCPWCKDVHSAVVVSSPDWRPKGDVNRKLNDYTWDSYDIQWAQVIGEMHCLPGWKYQEVGYVQGDAGYWGYKLIAKRGETTYKINSYFDWEGKMEALGLTRPERMTAA